MGNRDRDALAVSLVIPGFVGIHWFVGMVGFWFGVGLINGGPDAG
jgi:hypothetical protein